MKNRMQMSREWIQAKVNVGLAVCALSSAFYALPANAHPMGISGIDFDSRQVYVVFKPGTSDAAIGTFAATYATGPLKPAQYFFAPHDIRPAFILTLKPGLNPADIANAVGMTQLHSPAERASRLATHRMAVQGRATSLMGRLTGSPILDLITPRFYTHCLQTTITPVTGSTTTFAPGTFGPTATPITSFAFPSPAAIPNDPLFPQQWALDSNHLEALTAWAISPAAGSGIPVAVLDSGYDLTHEDLQTNIDISHSRSWTNPATDPNYFNITPEHQQNVETPTVSLDFDHGTSVSGIISATHNNGLGISGLAYNATLWFEKVEARFSAGDVSNNIDNNAIALAFQYVADRGVRVVNISLGSPEIDSQILTAVRFALSKGVIIVAASGNSGVDPDLSTHEVNYPAAIPGVWAVGASNFFNSATTFSNYNAPDFTAFAGQALLPTAHDIDFLAPGGACPVIPTTTTTGTTAGTTGTTAGTTGTTAGTTGTTAGTTGTTTATTATTGTTTATTATTGTTTATTATTGTTTATTATTGTTAGTTAGTTGTTAGTTTATTGTTGTGTTISGLTNATSISTGGLSTITVGTTGGDLTGLLDTGGAALNSRPLSRQATTTATTGTTTATTTGATTATTGTTTATTGTTTATTGATTATTGATTATTGATTATTGATTATTGATTATTGTITAGATTSTVVLPICPVCTTQGVETTTAAFNNGGITYLELQGTSFAAPHVAALAALILGRNPTLTPNQVYTIIAASCRPANTAEAILQASPTCMAAATTGSTGLTTGRTTATTTGTTTATTATTGTTTATTGTTTATTATTGTTTATTATTGTTTATTATTGTTTATTGGNTTGGVTTTTTAGTTGATTAVTTTAGLTTAGTTAGATTTGTTAGATGTTGATTATTGATTGTTGATTATTGTTSGGITGATSGTITGATSGITAGTTTPVMGIGATGLTTPDTRNGFGVVDAARALALTPPLLVLGVSPANGTVTANSTPTVSFTMDAADMQGFILLFNGNAVFQYIAPTVGSPPATVTGANGITYFPATGILTFRLPFASQTLPIPQNTPITFTVQAYGGSVSMQTPQSLSTTFTIQPVTLPAGISFFGIPFGLSGTVAQPQYVFSGAQFFLARWDPTTGTYRLFPSDTFASFAPPDATSANPTVTLPPAGIGYWVDVPQNTQLHIEGVDLPMTQYPIKVHAGWNQVANPFPYTIDWNGTQVLVGGQNETIAAAGTARVISSTAFTFTGRAYASLTAPSSNALAITAFQGFWVFAYQDATLLMAPNPIVSASDLL